MGLDKQRILSELGNVMNQIQNADCGCLGKVFSEQSNSSGHMGGTCDGHGFCSGQGYNNNYSLVHRTGMKKSPGMNIGPGMNMSSGMNMSPGLNNDMRSHAPQSPHGETGLGMLGNTPFSNPTTQYVTQDNTYKSHPNPATNMSPGATQFRNPNSFGQHTGAMRKFNEMFPGVGDEFFDPMAVAIQMNPTNQKQAAVAEYVNNAIFNQTASNAARPSQPPINQLQENQFVPIGHSGYDQSIVQNSTANPYILQGQQKIIPQNQKQIYTTAVSGVPQQGQAQLVGYQQGQIQQQQLIDPNIRAPVNYSLNTEENPNTQMKQMNILPPIFPVDTSAITKPTSYYNAIGQRVQQIRLADKCHPLPQNLYSQNLYTVKNTMSKTAIAPRRIIGSTPSRSELKHIYRQYKAHSTTQQNIRPIQGGFDGIRSQSDGKLVLSGKGPIHFQKEAPLEKFEGDTITNLALIKSDEKGEQNMDAELNKPHSDVYGDKLPMTQAKIRNGLQDVLHTRFQNGEHGWSFSGAYCFDPVTNYSVRTRKRRHRGRY